MNGRYDVRQVCPAGTQPYTIRAGDTYFSLAMRFNTTVAAIMAANPGVDPNRLQIGQVICIPGAPPMPGECPQAPSPILFRQETPTSLWPFGSIPRLRQLWLPTPVLIPTDYRLVRGFAFPVPRPCRVNARKVPSPISFRQGDTYFSGEQI